MKTNDKKNIPTKSIFANQGYNIFQKINFCLLAMLLLCFPIYVKASTPIIVALLLNWIAEGHFKTKFTTLFRNRTSATLFVLMLLFFVLTVLSLLYTQNRADGTRQVVKNLQFVVWPLLLLPIYNMRFTPKTQLVLADIYLTGVFGASLFYVVRAFAAFLPTGDVNLLLYDRFSPYVHTSYFATYAAVAFIICVDMLLNHRPTMKTGRKIATSILSFWNLAVVFLCNSRSGIIAMAVIIVIYTIFFMLRTKKYVPVLLIFIVLAAGIYGLYKVQPALFDRFNNFKTNTVMAMKTDIRTRILKCTPALIGENLWFGTAPGDVTDELVAKYHEYDVVAAEELKLNTHNQFVQVLVGMGIVGFSVFMAIWLIPLVVAIKRKDTLQIGFIAYASIMLLFEAMLQRINGIVFIVFFLLLLYNRRNIFTAIE